MSSEVFGMTSLLVTLCKYPTYLYVLLLVHFLFQVDSGVNMDTAPCLIFIKFMVACDESEMKVHHDWNSTWPAKGGKDQP